MPESLEERVRLLEEQSAKSREHAPAEKDVWDKLSALSALISGVIIASIGIWVNHSLTTGQERAQDAQANATRQMEKAHNDAVDAQAASALELQKRQAADALAFQKQQAVDGEALERLKMQQQRQQEAAVLRQQREHDAALLQLQQTQLAKDFIPLVAAGSASRATALKLLARESPADALIMAEGYSETSADASLRQTSEAVLIDLQKSADTQLSKAAGAARARVEVSKRIQEITNVFESGKPSRDYAQIGEGNDQGPIYGGVFQGTSLLVVLSRYSEAAGALQGGAVKPYLERVRAKDQTLLNDSGFRAVLIRAASDPVMQEIQDDEFDKRYWQPVQMEAAQLGLKLPLSIALLYDLRFQLGEVQARSYESDATRAAGNTPAMGADEKRWATEFAKARKERLPSIFVRFPMLGRVWLKRADFFIEMVNGQRWDLKLPLDVNGVTIRE